MPFASKNFLPEFSNFHPSVVEMLDVRGATVEHVYQAMKAQNGRDRLWIASAPTPGQAKRRGRSVPLRSDWEDIKDDVMWELLAMKFREEPLRTTLMSFEGQIIEHNLWHDNYFGSCVCARCGDRGLNMLGQQLMELRRIMRKDAGLE